MEKNGGDQEFDGRDPSEGKSGRAEPEGQYGAGESREKGGRPVLFSGEMEIGGDGARARLGRTIGWHSSIHRG